MCLRLLGFFYGLLVPQCALMVVDAGLALDNSGVVDGRHRK